MQTPLVTIDWLKDNLDDPDLIILDGSPLTNKASMKVQHPGLRIKGARVFDLKNKFSDKASHLPNMLPSPDSFTAECQKLGINKTSKVVVYDNLQIYSSPRVWWMFRAMGHDQVAVLDGGLNQWVATGGEIENISNNTYTPGDFVASYHPQKIRNARQLSDNLESKKDLIVDARSAGRFNGIAPEPRATSRSGHVPGSCNVPYTSLTKNGFFLPIEELKVIFEEMELGDKPLVFSCGSGMTACVTLLAASLVLDNELALYDASWSEWGNEHAAYPVVV